MSEANYPNPTHCGDCGEEFVKNVPYWHPRALRIVKETPASYPPSNPTADIAWMVICNECREARLKIFGTTAASAAINNRLTPTD